MPHRHGRHHPGRVLAALTVGTGVAAALAAAGPALPAGAAPHSVHSPRASHSPPTPHVLRTPHSAGRARRGGPRPAVTPACGTFCANYFVQEFGQRFVLNDYRGHLGLGTKILLYWPSNVNHDEDWTIWPAGTVSQLAAVGLVSRMLALHYGADDAFELQYAPYGVGSGLCAGVGRPPGLGAAVTLQWCGQSARTIWVRDAVAARGRYAPLISGAAQDFSDPQVLTEPGWPGSWPRPGLVTRRLREFADGVVYDQQMWDNTIGAVP
jgi:hypothetical protein